jgi:hypothetical protein
MTPFRAWRGTWDYDTCGYKKTLTKKEPVIVIAFIESKPSYEQNLAVCVDNTGALMEVNIGDIIDVVLPGIQWEHVV